MGIIRVQGVGFRVQEKETKIFRCGLFDFRFLIADFGLEKGI